MYKYCVNYLLISVIYIRILLHLQKSCSSITDTRVTIWETADCSHLLTLVLRSRIFLPWRWRRYVPPKRRFNSLELHGSTSQKTAFFIVTAVKTSNLTLFPEVFRVRSANLLSKLVINSIWKGSWTTYKGWLSLPLSILNVSCFKIKRILNPGFHNIKSTVS
jgi:hypothetical protein